MRAHVASGGTAQLHTRTHSLTIDASGRDADRVAPGPDDLLAGALATCVLDHLERAAPLLGVDYEDATVEVTGSRAEHPPRITGLTYVLVVATDAPGEQLERLRRDIATSGVVYNTLAAACRVRGSVVAVPLAEAVPPL